MEKKKAIPFTLSIVAIILGVTLYKKFDFKTLRFEHNGLAIIYGIVFISCLFLIIRNLGRR